MAKETQAQKDTVERVMHEFKLGELKAAGGRKVKNQKQAVAIALSEAGASKYESSKTNREHLRRTKRREATGKTGRDAAEGRDAGGQNGKGRSKTDLYAEARKRDIPGRSKMDKAQLERALSR